MSSLHYRERLQVLPVNDRFADKTAIPLLGTNAVEQPGATVLFLLIGWIVHLSAIIATVPHSILLKASVMSCVFGHWYADTIFWISFWRAGRPLL